MPSYDDEESYTGFREFAGGEFYTSACLAHYFSQWAADHAPACTTLTERQFFDKLAAFARTATNRLKGPMNVRFNGAQVKG